MKKMYRIRFLVGCVCVLLIGLLTIGCESLPETTKSTAVPSSNESVLLIQRDQSGSELLAVFRQSVMDVYIDDMLQMKVRTGETGRVVISNGQHSLYVAIDDNKIEKSSPVPFEIKSRQIKFSASIKKKKKIELMKIEETVVLDSAETRALDKILSNFTETFVERGIPDGSAIAIWTIFGKDEDLAIGFKDELEHKFTASGKYRLVERDALEDIRKEQKFQLSGDVPDDGIAAAVGKMLGARIVITGSITGTDIRRLRMKAIDALTAEVLTTISEQF